MVCGDEIDLFRKGCADALCDGKAVSGGRKIKNAYHSTEPPFDKARIPYPKNGVNPFIIDDKRRSAYNRGITVWEKDPSVLKEVALEAQKRFQGKIELYRLMQYTPAFKREGRD